MQQDPSQAQPAQPGTVPPTPGAGGGNSAEALSQMGFDHLIHNFDFLGWIVFVVLSVMSIASWFFIVANFLRNTMIRSRMDRVIHTFWDTPSAQDAVRFMEDQPRGEPFSKIALDSASAAAHHQRHEGSRLVEALNRSEFIDRALRQAVARGSMRLGGGLTLIRIAASGNASMEAVAGPVGEALIMTAFGLFVAIPAVLAYNFYVRQNRLTYAQFDEFAHDLHDFFATGSRVEAGAAPVAARK